MEQILCARYNSLFGFLILSEINGNANKIQTHSDEINGNIRNVNSLLNMVPTMVYEENGWESYPIKTCPYCSNKNEDVKMNWANQKQKISFSSLLNKSKQDKRMSFGTRNLYAKFQPGKNVICIR